jgi:hypothetical protein
MCYENASSCLLLTVKASAQIGLEKFAIVVGETRATRNDDVTRAS